MPQPPPAHPSAGPDDHMCLMVVHDTRCTHSEWWGIKNLESELKCRIFILAISLAQVNITKLCKLSGHPFPIGKLKITTFIHVACLHACMESKKAKLKQCKLIHTDIRLVVTRGEGGWESGRNKQRESTVWWWKVTRRLVLVITL